jgi:phosphoribosylformylglycinamidine (FGAM) synthase PurS component
LGDSIKVGVRILPREVILDTQGRAVEQVLKDNHFPALRARVGRYVELELPGPEDKALQAAKQMTEFVLYNPLIERFELQVIR